MALPESLQAVGSEEDKEIKIVYGTGIEIGLGGFVSIEGVPYELSPEQFARHQARVEFVLRESRRIILEAGGDPECCG